MDDDVAIALLASTVTEDAYIYIYIYKYSNKGMYIYVEACMACGLLQDMFFSLRGTAKIIAQTD